MRMITNFFWRFMMERPVWQLVWSISHFMASTITASHRWRGSFSLDGRNAAEPSGDFLALHRRTMWLLLNQRFSNGSSSNGIEHPNTAAKAPLLVTLESQRVVHTPSAGRLGSAHFWFFTTRNVFVLFFHSWAFGVFDTPGRRHGGRTDSPLLEFVAIIDLTLSSFS